MIEGKGGAPGSGASASTASGSGLMADKILFVDDEPAFLTAYQLMLPAHIKADIAVGGEQGLAAIRNHGPYAVVVSDMRMPGMDGIHFLSRVRQAAPDTIRMMLTGYSDFNAAMDAVNEGNVFRFLAKPCSEDALANAITSGLVQYRLITAEKDLLENTLMGSIKVLTEVLSAISPEAFGKSIRITRCMHHLIAKFHIPSSWCFEAAAMLSQLGCLMLDPELIRSAYVDTHLSAENRLRFEAHPRIARDLLANVRRLEAVAWIIGHQLTREKPRNPPAVPELLPGVLELGANMLRVAVAFDNLRMKGVSNHEAVLRLRYRSEFDPKLVDALTDLKDGDAHMELRKVPISTLTVGTILQQNITTHAGVLVVAKGQEITRPLLFRLEHFAMARLIDKEIMALIPS
jgi:response regulator RpfG family c-di-GMP phosphodiesterase